MKQGWQLGPNFYETRLVALPQPPEGRQLGPNFYKTRLVAPQPPEADYFINLFFGPIFGVEIERVG